MLKKNRQWLIIIFGFIAIAVSKPLLWPDGFGIIADKSVTTTVEKDPQGKITKIVETTRTGPGKTLWNWLNLLGVPITLAVLGYVLQQIQQKRVEKVANDQRERDQKIANDQRERDQKIANDQRELAADKTREEVLQVYFDRLSVLLVDKNLLAIAAKINSEKPEKLQTTLEEQELAASAVDVIRARTLSILRRFENDEERKTSVIRFLIEADFLSKLKLDLSAADLSGADLSGADLSGAYLRGADLRGAYLSGANLGDADLSGADLSGAKLRGTYLSGANLSRADLIDADLRGAKLSGAKLSGANLSGANLRGAYLSDADLRGAYLSDADLSDADLSVADLRDTDLNGAKLSGADLRVAKLSIANLRDADLSGANLSGVKEFSSKQIKSAKNWESALYDGKRLDDPEVSKRLGLDAKP